MAFDYYCELLQELYGKYINEYDLTLKNHYREMIGYCFDKLQKLYVELEEDDYA